jgi:hypothetical protein
MELPNEWLAPQPGHFIPEERAPGMYCIEGAWDPGWFGCFGEEKNLVLLPGIETWIIQSIT